MAHDFPHLDDGDYADRSTTGVNDVNEDLLSRLPPYLPRGVNTGHWALMRPAAERLREAEHDIQSVDLAQNVQDAETIDQLAELGKLLDTPPNEGEAKEHYRARLLAEGMLATSEGTIKDVIFGAAEILDVTMEDIGYSEPIVGTTENGTASLDLPGAALDSINLTNSEVATFLDDLASVGCRIQGIRSGTFTYITPNDYNSSNFDTTKAYDGLDTDGDPKDNGGTYAGVI